MVDDNVNGQVRQRVSNALLGLKMDHLSEQVDDIRTTLKDHCEGEEKWRSTVDVRLRGVETEQARQKESLRNATGFNAIWATVAAAIAGIIGSKS